MVDSIKKILWVIVISILCSWSEEKCRADELAIAFADPVLKQVVEKNLGVTDPTPTEMLRLVSLDAKNMNIESLKGIEYARNLKHLRLCANRISDLCPLSKLTQLTKLDLSGNPIMDISALSVMVDLRELHLYGTSIYDQVTLPIITTPDHGYLADISPLSSLIQLGKLGIGNNQIADISPLAKLGNLSELDLFENRICDVTPIAGLVNLKNLKIGMNKIVDISALSSLVNLEWLDVSTNRVENISVLSDLENLEAIDLSRNSIGDISALANLKKLKQLYLMYNNVSDISALVNMGSFYSVMLDNNPLNEDAYEKYLPILEQKCLNLTYSPDPYSQKRLKFVYVVIVVGLAVLVIISRELWCRWQTRHS